MRKLHSLFAVLALSGAAVSAQAQITMTTTDRIIPGYGISFSYSSVNGGTPVNGNTSYAGPFATNVVGPGIAFTNFDSYCVDLGHFLQPTETLNPKDIKTAFPTSGAQIAYLYDTFAAGVGGSAAKGAALQIAIWEVEYDYGVQGINLNAGNFQFTSVLGDDASNDNYNTIKGFITNSSNTGYLDHLPTTFAGTATFLDAVHPTSTTGQSSDWPGQRARTGRGQPDDFRPGRPERVRHSPPQGVRGKDRSRRQKTVDRRHRTHIVNQRLQPNGQTR